MRRSRRIIHDRKRRIVKKLTIRSRLIVLIGLMSLVSLGVGVVGLIQSSNGEQAFDRIFSNRVVSIGYLKNVEVAYTVQIIGAANKFSDGILSAKDALAAVQVGNEPDRGHLAAVCRPAAGGR